MVEKNNNDEVEASNRSRANLKKYSKVARTSMLAFTIGMTWNPAQTMGAPGIDAPHLPPEQSIVAPPVPYIGNSLDYFKNQFLPKSGFQSMGVGESAPTANDVAITGTARAGYLLTGSYTYEDLNDDVEDGTTFQWYRSDDAEQTVNYVPIDGATGLTYRLTSADVRKYITLVVTPRTAVEPTEGPDAKSEALGPISASVTRPVETVPTVTVPQQEEVLIEVVALKENAETQASAKLTVDRDEQGISTANINFITEGVNQSSEDATTKDTIAVRAETLIGARVVVGNVDGNAISTLQSKGQRLAIITGDVAINFPTVSLPLEEIARNSGVTTDKLNIEIKIERQPEAVKEQANVWASGENATVIGDPYTFSLQVNDGTNVTTIEQYGNRYAYMTVPIPEGITNLTSIGAVMLVDGKYVPVPVRINDDGRALIHAPTNATVMLIQRHEQYDDMADHWGTGDIHLMADKGNVNADEQGNYNPDAELSRAEFAEMLVRAFGLGHQDVGLQSVTFTDLPEDAAVRDSIRIATGVGLFSGVSEGLFAPDQKITREQMIAVLMRFYRQFELEADPALAVKSSGEFSDLGLTSDWAQSDVIAADEAGIISGYENGTVRPLTEGTRAEAAALIRRFLQKTGLTN